MYSIASGVRRAIPRPVAAAGLTNARPGDNRPYQKHETNEAPAARQLIHIRCFGKRRGYRDRPRMT
ncbi:hypothetical protein ACFL34_00870 [Candidatus Sumerlaeota bacterium]